MARPAKTSRRPLAWARLIAGLWLFAAGVVLALRSGLGMSPWDAFHDGIRQVTPLSFGIATIMVGMAVLAVAGALGVRPGPGTLVNIVAIGAFEDLMLATGIGADLEGACWACGSRPCSAGSCWSRSAPPSTSAPASAPARGTR